MSGIWGTFLFFDAFSTNSPAFFLLPCLHISPWVGVFIVYSAGMVCISFSTMMDAFTVFLLGSPGPELRAIFMIRWRASVFWKPGLSIGMACRASRLAGKKAGSDEKIGQERKGEFRTM